MKYTTLADLKEFLQIDTTDQDPILNKIIDTTTKLFDRYLGYNLGVKNYAHYLGHLENEYVIFPPYTPILRVNEAKANEKNIAIERHVEDIVYLREQVSGEIFLDYDAGYEMLEDIIDVQQACHEVCKEIYDQYAGNQTVEYKKVGDTQIKFVEENSIFDYKTVLDRYKISLVSF